MRARTRPCAVNRQQFTTPLPGGRAMHRALRGSRLLEVRGGRGHGTYPDPDSCTTRTVTAYPTSRRLPAGDVMCRS
ncbi:alpha/beta hydrolase [Streptomyces sp. R28]|uniref:Alpha/beta hydrolase n=1 Tax=Streptomyces sp. R28 TaxID=3238628 RepID=A0AB39Q3Y5_9ACTN